MRMRTGHLLAATALGATLATVALCARADVYGYVDANGIAHFAAEKLDERYQLFMQGNGASASSPAAQEEPAGDRGPLANYLWQHPNLKKFEPILLQAAMDFELDPALLKAVMAAESGFNPNAVSPKGAVGLMQVMPATAERYGLQGDRKQTIAQKLADPKINIRLGARYLRDLRRMFPSEPHLVLASYNAGEGAVRKYRNTIPPYPETRNYVQIVSEFYRMYKPAPVKVAIAEGMRIEEDPGAPSRRIRITIPGAGAFHPFAGGRGRLPATFPRGGNGADAEGTMPSTTLE
ncbi:MAG: lytic transglycosylase protein [Noviherbaspirillum sp.]|nr:lytic transglycosylase protein [Noviherbaspirillum sp.]